MIRIHSGLPSPSTTWKRIPSRQDQPKPPKAEEPKPSKEEKQQQKEEQKQQKDEMKHTQANPQGHPVAGQSAHIPDDKFHAHFGRQHTFVIHQPVVAGQTQFVYSGYTFVFLDPWPDGWAYTDDCYVDYIDGEYFLFDLLHPGIRIALFVSL